MKKMYQYVATMYGRLRTKCFTFLKTGAKEVQPAVTTIPPTTPERQTGTGIRRSAASVDKLTTVVSPVQTLIQLSSLLRIANALGLDMYFSDKIVPAM